MTITSDAPADGSDGVKHKPEDDAPPGPEPDAKRAKTEEGANGAKNGAEPPPPVPAKKNWGKTWKMDDGTEEEIVDILEEPRHHLDFANRYGRSFTIRFPPKDITLAHGHEYDTVIILLMKGGIKCINDVMGCVPQELCMDFKEVKFAPYTSKPCVHKITNLSDEDMFCINVEILRKAPISREKPLAAPHHSLVLTKDGCRVYKLSLEPGESADVSYDFFYTHVAIDDGKVEISAKGASGAKVSWVEEVEMGDIGWRDPCLDMTIKNMGDAVYEAYICEWC